MRFSIRVGLGLLLIVGVSAAAYRPARDYWRKRNAPEFRTEEVTRGDVAQIVTATGKIKPVETIKIGSFVSGPISDMPPEIDFNAPIAKDQLMARVDPRIYRARFESAQAALEIRKAEVLRAKAQLQQARNAEQRAIALRERKQDFVADAEMDQLKFGRQQLEAALTIAEASVQQAAANMADAEANLEFTYIRAPKAGIIIDRKIDPGQTLAAQFQTPELFEIGVDMRERMHIYASVDENDIGLIKQARRNQQSVEFTVNAYPEELFTGKIVQIRMSSTETQAVVTYPVVVEAPNPDLTLLPGMTADLSFLIQEKKDVLCIPNAALRFYPPKEHVREEDHPILDGSAWAEKDDEDEDDTVVQISARTRANARRDRNKRHVWVKEGDKLRAIEVETGLMDQNEGKTTELVEGELRVGQKLVTGLKKKGGLFGGSG